MEGAAAVFRLEETFEQLTAQAITNPSDGLAFDALRMHLAAVSESGQVQEVMSMAVVLGGMACLHPHLEGFANEMGELYGGMGAADEAPGHDYGSQHPHEESHDAKNCPNCKVGKICNLKK